MEKEEKTTKSDPEIAEKGTTEQADENTKVLAMLDEKIKDAELELKLVVKTLQCKSKRKRAVSGDIRVEVTTTTKEGKELKITKSVPKIEVKGTAPQNTEF